MFVCWSVKGGSGTTVVSCALAMSLGRMRPTLLVDLAGDVPAALGIGTSSGPGASDWASSPMGDRAALDRLAIPVADDLRLITRGSGPVPPDRMAHLREALMAFDGECVVDAGLGEPPLALREDCTSLLVIRPCYLAIRNAVTCGVQPTGIVVVNEPSRALSAADIARAVAAPVVASIPFDPVVSRSVDAGMLAARLPRAFDNAFDDALDLMA